MQLQALKCSACGGPVPLADADAVACPYCAAQVPVPEEHRQLRRGLSTITDERRAAARLYRRLGKPPPRFLRAFTFFESAWFWMLAAGFWITGGLAAFLAGTPVVGAALFHVNTWDVLTDGQQQSISIGGSLGTIVLGLLLAGWSHRRVVSRRGLQAAMAAAPPHAPGGPACCRVCGAALVVVTDALGARCDYCLADNLVQLPPELVARARRIAQKLTSENNAAIMAEAKARSSLRWSLFWRLFVGGGFTALVAVPIGFGDYRSVARWEVKLYGAADQLPRWSRDEVPHFECDSPDGFPGYPLRLSRCGGSGCEDAALVALEGRKPFRVVVKGSTDLEVVLEGRSMGIYAARWTVVARAPLQSGGVTLVPPLTGWYRVRFVSAARATIEWCGTQK